MGTFVETGVGPVLPESRPLQIKEMAAGKDLDGYKVWVP